MESKGGRVLGLSQLDTKHEDPFTGQPLKLRRDGDRVMIYSVGPDLKDDNGMHRSNLPANERKAGWDMVVASPPIQIQRTEAAPEPDR
jgi:hypothetical protein